MATKREKAQNKMRQSFETSQDTQEPENSGEVKTFDFYLDLPEGTKRWFPETAGDEHNGEHFFDIIPFYTGNKYPTEKWVNKKSRRVIDVNCNKGDLFYKLDIWYHKKVGPDVLSVPCPKRNYGQPCPICEWVEEQRKVCDEETNKRIWSDHGPKRQSVYNVFVCDKDGKRLDEDIQVFNIADFYMEEHLRTLSKPRRGGIIYYADPDEGKTIAFNKVDGGDYPDYNAHEFLDRDYSITDEEINKAICLDECIKEYTYDEIKSICGLYDVSKVNESDIPNFKKEEVKKDVKSPEKKVDNSSNEFECPYGGEFGSGYDTYQDCDDCSGEIRKACRAASQKDDLPF